ncbi:hypothetical protein DSO57_1003925 [Entomophthora muscae]|uniref:Uncharacterized protein n=1 Tax=Entomophthora muscae TaxID=34485 RepID=A0ACC2RZ95_9FUNG|nr:hypothetical protein DSO57_1003925 [Entomophthora muscae]
MPANLGTIPPTVKTKTLVLSQCPEFYAEDTLILLQAIYLGLFWLGTWVTIPHLLFCNKYNYLPTYLVPMTLPLTMRPNRLQESVATNE